MPSHRRSFQYFQFFMQPCKVIVYFAMEFIAFGIGENSDLSILWSLTFFWECVPPMLWRWHFRTQTRGWHCNHFLLLLYCHRHLPSCRRRHHSHKRDSNTAIPGYHLRHHIPNVESHGGIVKPNSLWKKRVRIE